MRTWGRVKQTDGTMGPWVQITETSYLWLATLVQTLRLQKGESPFYASYGISGQQSVISQIAPDADISRTQAQYSPYFASLTISRDNRTLTPTYPIQCIFLDGTVPQPSAIAT